MSEAYLIGNGYSLTSERLDTLKGKITFAMNGIAGMFSRTDWRPTFYIRVTTRYRQDGNFRLDVENAVKSSELSFIDKEYSEKNFFKTRDDVRFVETHERLEWCNDLTCLSKFATSMITAMQIASFMGFDPLYLYGVDGYRKEGQNHFSSNYYMGTFDFEEEQNNSRIAYEFARDNCPSKIYDLTESQGFGVFPRE